MKRLLSYACVVAAMQFAATAVFAKTINMYSEPKVDSKVTGTINTEAGVTIVYTPKNSDWVKVANSTNGNVGWIKSSELGGNGYNMRIFTSNNGAQNYRVYQFGSGNTQLNQKQLENEMRQFEHQQRRMQMHMAHMFNDMYYFTQPVFIPVVMMPEKPKLQKSSAKTSQTAQAVKTTG